MKTRLLRLVNRGLRVTGLAVVPRSVVEHVPGSAEYVAGPGWPRSNMASDLVAIARELTALYDRRRPRRDYPDMTAVYSTFERKVRGPTVSTRFENWPENLPRAELVRLLRGYAGQCHLVEQVLARALGYPVGDGVDFPADQYLVIDEDAIAMAQKAEQAIKALGKHWKNALDLMDEHVCDVKERGK